MSWGVDSVNNNGWSWSTSEQGSGWDQAFSDITSFGGGPIQQNNPTSGPSTSTSKATDNSYQDKERRASSPDWKIADLESPLADPIRGQRQDSVDSHASKKHASTTREQSASTLKENNDAGRAPSLTPTDLSSTGSGSRNQLKFYEPMQAFELTVKTLRSAARLQIEYNLASAEVDQWRRTQNSEAYGHATLATRKKLEEKRAEIGTRQGDAQKKLKASIGMLAQISSPQPANIIYIINDSEMIRFRNEHMEWMQQVSQHPVMQETEEKGPDRQPVDESIQDLEPESKSVFLKQPSQWMLDDIAKALAELDGRAEAIAEEVYHEGERPKLCDESPLNAIEAKKAQYVESAGQASLAALAVQYEEQYQRIDNKLAVSVENVTALLEERARLKNELAASAALSGSLGAMYKELTADVEESERLMTQDEEQLTELISSVQNLLTARPPSTQSNLDTDELLSLLQARIIQHLTDELATVVQNFKSECLQYDKTAQAVVDKISDFIVRAMDEVAKAAQARVNAETARK